MKKAAQKVLLEHTLEVRGHVVTVKPDGSVVFDFGIFDRPARYSAAEAKAIATHILSWGFVANPEPLPSDLWADAELSVRTISVLAKRTDAVTWKDVSEYCRIHFASGYVVRELSKELEKRGLKFADPVKRGK